MPRILSYDHDARFVVNHTRNRSRSLASQDLTTFLNPHHVRDGRGRGGGGGGQNYGRDREGVDAAIFESRPPSSSRLARASSAAYHHNATARRRQSSVAATSLHRPLSSSSPLSTSSNANNGQPSPRWGGGGGNGRGGGVASLSMTVAKDISLKEIQGRNAVSEEEAEGRVALLSAICASQLKERINMLVTTFFDAYGYSRSFFEKEETKVWRAMMDTHKAQMTYLRSIIPIEVVNEKIRVASEEEARARRTLWFLEQKTLQDVCDVFNVENNYGVPRKKGSAVAGARQAGAVLFLPTLVEWPADLYATEVAANEKQYKKGGDVTKTDEVVNVASADRGATSVSPKAASASVPNPRHIRLLEAAGVFVSRGTSPAEGKEESIGSARQDEDGEDIYISAYTCSAMVKPPSNFGGHEGARENKKRGEDVKDGAARRVRVGEGCPFRHPRDCPFDVCGWVDAEAFRRDHIGSSNHKSTSYRRHSIGGERERERATHSAEGDREGGARRMLPPSAAPILVNGRHHASSATVGYEDILAHRESVVGGMHHLSLTVAGDAVVDQKAQSSMVASAAAREEGASKEEKGTSVVGKEQQQQRPSSSPPAAPSVSPRVAMAARLAYEYRHLPKHMHPSSM